MPGNKTITIVLKGINQGNNSNDKKSSRRDEVMREFDRKMFASAKQITSIGFGRYAALTEDYLANNTKDFVTKWISIFDQADDTIDRISSITSKKGYNYETGGIRGALKGYGYAAATVGFTLSSAYFKNQSRLSSIYRQLNETNFQTGLDASRAGLINNGRGTQN